MNTAPGVCVCVCPLLQVCVCVYVCVHCSVCVCVCVHCSRCVCTWMGQIQRTHFTASYTLYNCVCDKKNIYIYIGRSLVVIFALKPGLISSPHPFIDFAPCKLLESGRR